MHCNNRSAAFRDSAVNPPLENNLALPDWPIYWQHGEAENSWNELRGSSKECLEAVRQRPGCETVGGIQIIRENTPGGFSVRGTLYGKADKKIADRAINCVQREKRRHFHLND